MPVPPAIPARSPLRLRSPTVAEVNMPPVDRYKPLPDPHPDNSPPPVPSSALTKRQHALHELLSSERAYASDLALVREVHIPLALGQPISISLPVSTPNSSGSSSARSSTADQGAPMSPEDVRLIFGNIVEIAVFSELFCQALEAALGDLVATGTGPDYVGNLFLNTIPELERLYKTYITRQAGALTHLQELPQTAAMQNYLAQTQSIASSLSHAWDISSLLIKPVQRLLKYPLLLAAIIEETPDTHPDKANLREARKQMEEAARNVNEGRRRAEVVREVLSASKKRQVTKIKSLRPPPPQAHEEAVLVHRLQNELYDMDEFARKFAMEVVEWVAATNNTARQFRAWAVGFGNVLGLTEEQPSEAFNAFLNVIENYLLAVCADLAAIINERFMKELTLLLSTMITPMKLLQSMNERAPYHYHLLNVNISSKNRPPPSLLAASTNYLALRGQLAAELPTYVTLLHRGLLIFVKRLITIQTDFWAKVRDQWLLLWEMLRLEEELNVSTEETSSVWFARWAEIDGIVASLPIMQSPHSLASKKLRSISHERPRVREREWEVDDPEADAEFYAHHHLQSFASHNVPVPEYTPQDQRYSQNPPPSYFSNSPPSSTNRSSTTSDSLHTPYSSSLSGGYFNGLGGMGYERPERGGVADRGRNKEKDKDKRKKSVAQAMNTISMLSSLEPNTVISSPVPLSPKPNLMTKSRANSDFSSGGKKSVKEKESDESLSSKTTAKSPKHHPPHSPRQLPQQVQSTADNSRPIAHTQRRKTMSAVEHAPEDLKEYEKMVAREQERVRERERGRNIGGYVGRGGNADAHIQYQQHMAKFGGIPRTKSMPLPYHPAEGVSYQQHEPAMEGAGEWSEFVDEDDSDLFYHVAAVPNEEYDREESGAANSSVDRDTRNREKSPSHRQRSAGNERGDEKTRPLENTRHSNMSRGQSAERCKKDKEKPSSRTRSGSIKSITSFFTSNTHHKRGSHGDIGTSQTSQARSPRDSWAHKPAKYMCQVIHPCKPPMTGSTPISYFSFPFFTLREEELYDVLQEAGHPSLHPNLPLKVEEGEEDCLLLCRAYDGSVGWALASFLEPIEI